MNRTWSSGWEGWNRIKQEKRHRQMDPSLFSIWTTGSHWELQGKTPALFFVEKSEIISFPIFLTNKGNKDYQCQISVVGKNIITMWVMPDIDLLTNIQYTDNVQPLFSDTDINRYQPIPLYADMELPIIGHFYCVVPLDFSHNVIS